MGLGTGDDEFVSYHTLYTMEDYIKKMDDPWILSSSGERDQ